MKTAIHPDQHDLFGGLPVELRISGSVTPATPVEPDPIRLKTDDVAAVPGGSRSTPLVVGVDPSLTGTGIATSLGICTKVGRDGITKLPLDVKLAAIDNLVTQILAAVGTPDLVLIELPAFSRAVGGAFERHALWWLLVRELRARRLPVAVVNVSSRMRYATGKGAASKSAIVDAVARRLPMFETGGDNDLADAAILCAIGADKLGWPLADMPKPHRLALDAVEWPELIGATSC